MSAGVLLPDKNVGRPYDYTDAQAAEVLGLIVELGSLTKACKRVGIPSSTVWAWRANNPSFSQALARAREESAPFLVEEGMEIVDTAELSHEAIGLAKLRAEYRKWMASKHAPRQYGDKLDVTGDLAINVTIRRFSPNTIEGEAAETIDAGQVPTLPA